MSQSQLTPYAPTLLDKRLAGEKIKELQEWLKQEGVVVGHSTVADFVSQLLEKRERNQLLDRITSGASQVKEVEERFKGNPAPELETLIKLHRVLILQLSTQGNADPEFLKLADKLLRTAMEFVSGQTKANLESQKLSIADRRTKLLEKKAAQAEATDKVLTDAQLSPEQRERRIKEIYGRV